MSIKDLKHTTGVHRNILENKSTTTPKIELVTLM